MLFGCRCGVCGRRGPSPCGICVDRLVALEEIEVDGVDRCLALLDYDAVSQRLVAELKYIGVRTAVPWFAEALAQRVEWAGEAVEHVTWIPAAPQNIRRRGFDQSEHVARRLGRVLDLPVGALLDRHPDGGQTGRSREARLRGPALGVTDRGLRSSATVLIVDDVLTTGASMAVAGQLLRDAGAGRVVGAVLAHRRFR